MLTPPHYLKQDIDHTVDHNDDMNLASIEPNVYHAIACTPRHTIVFLSNLSFYHRKYVQDFPLYDPMMFSEYIVEKTNQGKKCKY